MISLFNHDSSNVGDYSQRIGTHVQVYSHTISHALPQQYSSHGLPQQYGFHSRPGVSSPAPQGSLSHANSGNMPSVTSTSKVSSSRAQPQQIQIAHKVPQNGSTENIRAPPQQLQLVAELPQISSTEGIQQDVPELSAVKECIQEDLPFTEEEIPGLDADLPLAEAEILGSDVDSSRFILQNPDIADGSVVDNQRELDPGESSNLKCCLMSTGAREDQSDGHKWRWEHISIGAQGIASTSLPGT
ncbi:hypothetical protein V6N13_022077 [Hibiscus sabdariffa]